MTQYERIIAAARSTLTAANEPTRLKALRDAMPPEFEDQYVNLVLHRESEEQENPRIVRVGHGVYALPEWGAQSDWRSEHSLIIAAACSVLADANRPLTPAEIRDYLPPDNKFGGNKLGLSLHREAKRRRGKVARVGYGLYTLAPSPVKPKTPEPPKPPESPKTYIEALCDVIRTYEPNLTDEQREAVTAALQAAVGGLLGGDSPPQPPQKGWLMRLGLGD